MNTVSIIRSVLVSGVLGLAALGSVAPASASTVIRQQVTQFDAFGNRITKTRVVGTNDFGGRFAAVRVSRTDASATGSAPRASAAPTPSGIGSARSASSGPPAWACSNLCHDRRPLRPTQPRCGGPLRAVARQQLHLLASHLAVRRSILGQGRANPERSGIESSNATIDTTRPGTNTDACEPVCANRGVSPNPAAACARA